MRDKLPQGHIVSFDPLLLRAALLRLVRNGFDFSQDGSTVELSLFLSEQGTAIEVRDHGIGIRGEDREYIFNPFFSTQVHGSGMGLAIVERVVHEHMGRIEVESEPGEGSTIRIILPDTLNPSEASENRQD